MLISFYSKEVCKTVPSRKLIKETEERDIAGIWNENVYVCKSWPLLRIEESSCVLHGDIELIEALSNLGSVKLTIYVTDHMETVYLTIYEFVMLWSPLLLTHRIPAIYVLLVIWFDVVDTFRRTQAQTVLLFGLHVSFTDGRTLGKVDITQRLLWVRLIQEER